MSLTKRRYPQPTAKQLLALAYGRKKRVRLAPKELSRTRLGILRNAGADGILRGHPVALSALGAMGYAEIVGRDLGKLQWKITALGRTVSS